MWRVTPFCLVRVICVMHSLVLFMALSSTFSNATKVSSKSSAVIVLDSIPNGELLFELVLLTKTQLISKID